MMRRTHLAQAAAFVLVVASLTACGAPSAAPPSPAAAPVDTAKVADEVMAAIHTQVNAYAARDPAAAASILAPDVVSMFHGAPNLVGQPAGAESIKAQMADPAAKLEVSDETVDVAQSGDMAIYHATYRFTFTDPAAKKPTTETGNWVAVFKRQPGGAMKLSHDMVLDTPAQP